jgi:hypothetical protein
MSECPPEDYARVAVAIGMHEITAGYGMVYHDPATPWHRDPWSLAELPAYLAEPAQKDRIQETLKIDLLWSPEENMWRAQYWDHDAEVVMAEAWATESRHAVRHCAARALRP